MQIVVNIARWLVGLLFIFSGSIKANDPIGFSYKLEEYFVLFGMEWLASLALILAMFICVLEIILGLSLILGVKSKEVSWLLLLMILFFTWLTGYSAVTGRVTDCGCFGDAIPLTPWESFYKDLILLVLILIIFFYRKTIQPLIKASLAYKITGICTIIVIAFMLWCYYHLPVIDFRAYKTGTNIMEAMNDGIEADIELTFIYKNKNTGEQKEFKAANLPQGDEWTYVDRKENVIKEGKIASIHDFEIRDDEGEEYTEDLISAPGYTFMVVAYDISKTDVEGFKDIVQLSKAVQAKNQNIFAVTASVYQEVESLRHDINAAFPFYYVDATALKTIIRSNPGLVIIKDGVITTKFHANDIPSYQELEDIYMK